MGKKKILFVVEAMGGGVFTYIVDLSNRLSEKYDVSIAHGIREQTPKDYKSYFDPRVHLYKVENFVREIRLSKDARAFCEIQHIAQEVKPDIIHLHSSKAGVLGRFAFNGKKIPLFYTPHGYSFLMEDCRKAKRIVFKTIEWICAKRSCTTISCSAGEHFESQKLTSHALCVDNGVNREELQHILSVTEKIEHPFTVFTLGRICGQKNPEMFNRVAREMPDVRFVWIGDGDSRQVLTAPNIEVTGWIDRPAAIQKAVSADVFFLPSRWEGLPISLLEAMYMKKICVVSNVVGNRDVIQNGRNGFVCEHIQEYIDAIRTAQSKNCIDLVNAAQNDILVRYNTQSMAEKYDEIYTAALSKN